MAQIIECMSSLASPLAAHLAGDSEGFAAMRQDWSKCVDAKRGDGHNFTEECRDPTLNLQHCMEEHRDYYQVQPRALP